MPVWTKEQNDAIYKSGTNIIVSAGAGSGKTAVLSERVIDKLKQGIHINELLILTFTKAAASEMKERIRKKIKKENLVQELDMIDAAYITTFDSFALSIVKKYHYLINVSKDVNIIEESVVKIKKEEFLDEIFEEKYRNDNDFKKLISDFCVKDDKEIRNQILNISDKLDMLIDKIDYLKNYQFSDINKDINSYLIYIKKQVLSLEDIITELSDYIDSEYLNKLYESINPLLSSVTYDEIKINSNLKLPPLPRGSLDETKKIKDKLNKKIKSINDLCSYENIDNIKDTILKTKDYVKVIIDIILKLTKKINYYKYQNDLYEFTDIALLAIKIVKEHPHIALELKNSFKEIMIDEYQDTNYLQEEFIKYISSNNVYMVGDIKQSIYRFRNANPNIFKNKYDSYSKEIGGIKIDLNKNFRSRKEVLDDINLIFNLIMNDDIGGADYLKTHQMVFGNNAYINEGATKQDYDLEILEYENNNNNFSKDEVECFLIANDIKNKIDNNYQVFDKDELVLRKARYSDFVILLDRSANFDLFKKIFEYHQIPLNILKEEKMNNDQDIYVLNNLIKFVIKVNNKEYDSDFRYLFISIMRSFIYNEKDDVIFKYFLNKNYYDSDLFKKAKEISIDFSPSYVINEILEKFSFYEKLITIGNIEASLIKVDQIIDMANNLTDYDIILFSNHLDKMIRENYQMKYQINNDLGDAVKIMTIHKSKGLEYHICYFANMYKSFNIRELNEKFLYSNKYGIVTPYFDEGIGNTIYKTLIKEDYIKEEISEKIRLFYVALTRAKEKMIMVIPYSEINSFNKELVLKNDIKEQYRSFLDIINSIKNRLEKYLIKVDVLNLTKDYNLIKENNYDIFELEKLNVENIIVENEEIKESNFSKKINEVITKDKKKLLKFGTEFHELLENLDFNKEINLENKFYQEKINNFLKSDILKNYQDAKIFKEYEFMYIKDDIKYHGIIDLMLEYDDHIDIIDYKLKNIDDKKYVEQLTGYKNFIESKSNKKVNLYLYSIIDSKFLTII